MKVYTNRRMILTAFLVSVAPLAKGLQFDGKMTPLENWKFAVVMCLPIGFCLAVTVSMIALFLCRITVNGKKRLGWVSACLSFLIMIFLYFAFWVVYAIRGNVF